ncbi:hypothetical protein K435DRAFT_800791 [Dendrothele bispora CBS 962.96]|uniref:Uncharacterized protein n=1 Tax=Dendrothele bispora (strain CBS 962.96) TaxID=1314807 RepID=A0A4S8LRI2_DENBC|nr:hypothetical protein K435DRAFT_800791 [Dendrothele bispora CBS 962.96]
MRFPLGFGKNCHRIFLLPSFVMTCCSGAPVYLDIGLSKRFITVRLQEKLRVYLYGRGTKLKSPVRLRSNREPYLDHEQFPSEISALRAVYKGDAGTSVRKRKSDTEEKR